MFNLFKIKEEPKELKAYLDIQFEYAPVTTVNTNLMTHSLDSGTALDWLKKAVFTIKPVM